MVIVATLGAVLCGGQAAAVPPANPGDGELQAAEEDVERRAEEVDRLGDELADVEARLAALQAEVGAQREAANKARVDHARAVGVAERAERSATVAAERAAAARHRRDAARHDFDAFVAGSFRQGAVIGSIGAYLGARSPQELLQREQLLGAVGDAHLGTLTRLQDALTEAADADAAAREALSEARDRRDEAERAADAADAATREVVSAAQEQEERLASVEEDKRRVETRLVHAREVAGGLHAQRDRYEEWRDRQKQAPAQAPAASAPSGASSSAAGSGAAGATVETVVSRALSQVGVPYAWGGGNADGPTYGIRDGGIADSHGDYRKIGFDCSGLMIYAFAPVTALPHYSGYQYHAGRKVPVSQMRRGDMLFWGPDHIHHVALYLGDGQMVEAPYSGGYVRVTPVRYDGLMPYVTRLVE
ncbi:NlpC/P60 family protein [Saccharomonospora azurea]|uniref:NlpC/P60 family protein n=2 Tax=Saccharomonospora azurea TaxID=40988 RepID=UPI003D930714